MAYTREARRENREKRLPWCGFGGILEPDFDDEDWEDDDFIHNCLSGPMRILHTSDWHLGQHFMGKTREREHRAFLTWLRETVQAREADALVVTGDIFDTGTPPSYARALYNEFVVSLQESSCSQLVILGGNHDSAATLNEGKSLLACLKTRVIAGLSNALGDHLVVVRDADGVPGLLVCALPFLRPSDLVQSMGGQSGQEKKEALGQAIEAVYAGLFDRARALGETLETETGCRPLPIMATGHLTVVGASSSESVREIYIGSLSGFPASGFPAADYIALGHLHRAQKVSQSPLICYPGSPIPLSFDEASQTKQVIQVDFEPGRSPEIEEIPIPCFRTLISLRGSLASIKGDLAGLGGDSGAAADPGTGPQTWLEVEVGEDDFLDDLTDRIQAMIQEAGLRNTALLRVRRQRRGPGQGLVPETAVRLEELSPKEVFQRRLALEKLDSGRERELTSLFDEILEQVTAPEGAE